MTSDRVGNLGRKMAGQPNAAELELAREIVGADLNPARVELAEDLAHAIAQARRQGAPVRRAAELPLADRAAGGCPPGIGAGSALLG